MSLSEPSVHPPDTIAGHTVVREIGRGPSGTFYEVEREGSRAALKLLHAPLPGEARAQSRFDIDAADVSAFRHERFVHTLAGGSHDGRPFVVSQMVDGRSFADLLAAGEAPDAETICWAVSDLAHALAKLHETGLAHRNLKPSNVHYRPGGTWMIVDPGIHLAAGAPAEPGPFLAPEVVGGAREEIDGRADVYSLGALIRESVGDDLPAGVAEVVERCLRNRPEKRYQTTRLVFRDLRAALRG